MRYTVLFTAFLASELLAAPTPDESTKLAPVTDQGKSPEVGKSFQGTSRISINNNV